MSKAVPHSKHTHPDESERLLLAGLLNLLITIAEFAGGILSNSLSLLSDAVHNLGDTFAVMIAYMANRIGRRAHNIEKTFGFRRVEILAALLNSTILLAVCLYLFIEAFHRLQHPEAVRSRLMLIVAALGLAANLVAVLILHKDSGKNLNVKAAYLHLIGDTLSSLVVLATGIIMKLTSAWWLDPLVSFLIGIYILTGAFGILKQAVNILMQATPAGLDLEEVKKMIEGLDEVENVHHMHAWNLTDRDIHLECHIDLARNYTLSETDSIRHHIDQLLCKNFSIDHLTVQFEYDCCGDKRMIAGK
jgi:cobalt-zinc-cadmium efflux system protein